MPARVYYNLPLFSYIINKVIEKIAPGTATGHKKKMQYTIIPCTYSYIYCSIIYIKKFYFYNKKINIQKGNNI